MTEGATKIYNQYVRPFHRRHKNRIEDFAEAMHEIISVAGSKASKEAAK